MQVSFFLAGQLTQVKESIPWCLGPLCLWQLCETILCGQLFLSTYVYLRCLKFHQRVQVISTSFLGIVYNIISFVHCFFCLHSSCVHMMIFFFQSPKVTRLYPVTKIVHQSLNGLHDIVWQRRSERAVFTDSREQFYRYSCVNSTDSREQFLIKCE